MALIKFGGGVIDARGSIGGNVFSRNRYGNYMRARTTPVNPQSSRQSAIRAIVASIAVIWNGTLTAVQRAAWGVFASNVPSTNKLGEVINLSGFNQFVKSNTVKLNAGLASLAVAPTIFTLPGEDPDFSATVDAGTGKVSVVFDATRDWADEDTGGLVVQVGIPVNPSIEYFNGPWRSAGIILGDGATPPTSPDATLDCPFEVADDQKIFVRAKILRADGRVSDWFRSGSIVATA